MSIDKKSFEDYERMFHSSFSKWFGEGSGIFVAILIVVFAFGILSSFYTVQPEEEAVVLRFGKYIDTTPPGLHFKLPFGIDRVLKEKTKEIRQESFGFIANDTNVTSSTLFQSKYRNKKLDEESLMLTGDLNVADVGWVVQYQISDLRQYLFNTKNPVQNIRDVSQATMRRVVGDRAVDDVIRGTDMEAEAAKILQEVLDSYGTGVRIVSVKIKRAYPPEEVKDSFNEVNAAKQEQEQLINEAEAHYNQIIPKARGEAAKKISEAKGKAISLVNKAKGDVEKFNKLLVEYEKAPQITKKRLYLETMEKLLSRFDAVTVVDPDIKGLIPVFPSHISQEKLSTSSSDSLFKGQLKSSPEMKFNPNANEGK